MFTREELCQRYGFLGYQADWIVGKERFQIGLWSRQSGKDYTCAAEAVLNCAFMPKTNWVILGCGERQALETIAKAKEWAEKMGLGYSGTREIRKGGEALLKAAEVTWPNGSKLRALPAKPATIRGYSANLVLTEFAFHEQAPEIWKAIYPAISNPMRGGFKRLRIITTPNGQGNCFHDLWRQSEYHRSRITIHEASEAGLPLGLEELRKGIQDAEAWAQEYECEFVDQSTVLLPYDLLQSCESAEAQESSSPQDLSRLEWPLFAGIDFGRKHDRTVCWVLQQSGEHLVTREVLSLERMATPEQFEQLSPRVKRARRVCLDNTGAGVGLGDMLTKAHGEYAPDKHLMGKVALCNFTPALKAELFPRLRAAFERGVVQIPVSRAVREDLHAVHRVVSKTGNITYRASHTADGHSDRATALALALKAAQLSRGWPVRRT